MPLESNQNRLIDIAANLQSALLANARTPENQDGGNRTPDRIFLMMNMCSMINNDMKEQILKLRTDGKNYKEIVKIVGCSKSTVAYYCNPKVREKAIKDNFDYKRRKRENLPLKTSSDTKILCLNCQKHVMKKREWSKNERKFCNKQCELKYKEDQYLKEWLSGNHRGYVEGDNLPLSSFVRRYIRNKYEDKCAECGWNVINPFSNICNLEIHHIDGDASNCMENNLILLCPNCHSLTKNYKYLNENSSRK